MKIRSLVATVCLAVAVSAQDITIAATSTPVLLAANAGAVVDTSQLVLTQANWGQSASALAFDAPALSLGSAVWSVLREFERVRRCSYSIRGLSTAGGSGSVTIGMHDVVIELTSPVPRMVTLTWIVGSTATGGPLPLFDVDMRDDGVLDGSGTQAHVQLGTQPYRIRICAQAATVSPAGQASNVQAQFDLEIVPDNNLGILHATQGCGPQAFVHESFTGGGVEILSPGAQLAVFGFAAQPVLLPNASQSAFPCLLYPQLDVATLLPHTGLVVPIPASARPVSFFVQAVGVISAGDFRTSEAFYVNAY